MTSTVILAMVVVVTVLYVGVITPAISVLSAAEGLEVADPSLKVAVLPARDGQHAAHDPDRPRAGQAAVRAWSAEVEPSVSRSLMKL